MSTTPTPRIFFLIARAANTAVVFRRGPTKWTQMLVWNLDDDTLVYGQWSKVKFQKWRCDLSPSGKYLIYLDSQFENGDSATIISKPPYWTAITKWKHGDPLSGNGGGVFRGENAVELNWHFMPEAEELFPVSPQLTVTCRDTIKENDKGECTCIDCTCFKRDGWSSLEPEQFIVDRMKEQDPIQAASLFWKDISREIEEYDGRGKQLWSKPITKSAFLYRLSFYHFPTRKRLNRFYIKKRKSITEIEGIEWAEVDYNGRIIAAKQGTLLASKRFKDGAVQLNNLVLLHDLNSQKPTKVPVPEEMRKW